MRHRPLLGSVLLLAAASAAAPTSQPTTAPSLLGYRPIQYFQDHCANCHGDYGSTYEPDFNRRLDDAQLAEAIRTMAEGPGRAPLTAEQVRVQAAYHRVLGEAKPFVSVSESKRDGDELRLTGDVTPGAKVRLQAGTQAVDATVTDHAWTAVLKPSPDVKVTVTATDGAHTATTTVP